LKDVVKGEFNQKESSEGCAKKEEFWSREMWSRDFFQEQNKRKGCEREKIVRQGD
jgi:hypothetical protein